MVLLVCIVLVLVGGVGSVVVDEFKVGVEILLIGSLVCVGLGM